MANKIIINTCPNCNCESENTIIDESFSIDKYIPKEFTDDPHADQLDCIRSLAKKVDNLEHQLDKTINNIRNV